MYTPYFPCTTEIGRLWVQDHEVALATRSALVRCHPLSKYGLPDGATSLLLRFGDVIAFRAMEEPWDCNGVPSPADLPRMPDGKLVSGFMWSTETPWVSENGGNLYHHVLLSHFDFCIQLLTSVREPVAILEWNTSEPDPAPVSLEVKYGKD